MIGPDLDPGRSFTADEPTVGYARIMHLEARHVPMRVPTRHLEDRRNLVEGAAHTSQLFGVGHPTFEPVLRRQAACRNAAGLPWDWMTFLVHDTVASHRAFGLGLRAFGDPIPGDLPDGVPDWRDVPTAPGPCGFTEIIAPDRLHGFGAFFDLAEDGALDSVVPGRRHEGASGRP